jgi:hypothetical protein
MSLGRWLDLSFSKLEQAVSVFGLLFFAPDVGRKNILKYPQGCSLSQVSKAIEGKYCVVGEESEKRTRFHLCFLKKEVTTPREIKQRPTAFEVLENNLKLLRTHNW